MEQNLPDRAAELEALQGRLGYRFADAVLLAAALTHASAIEAHEPRAGERLEFLGDAVLGLVLSDLLLVRYPGFDEGRLSKSRAALVNTASFADRARELGLDRAVHLGKGEEKTGGREKASILAATYEAVMGAVFVDGGYAKAREVAAQHFVALIDKVGQLALADAKTELQEVCQQRFRLTPVYRVVQEAGPGHARRFVVEVLLGDCILGAGEGPSKRAAEQEAARRALAEGLAAAAGAAGLRPLPATHS